MDNKKLLVTLVNNSYSDWQGSIFLKEGNVVSAWELMEDEELTAENPIQCSVPMGDLRVIEIEVDTEQFFAITTTSLPDGTTGVYYSQTLTATGGTTAYTWGVSLLVLCQQV